MSGIIYLVAGFVVVYQMQEVALDNYLSSLSYVNFDGEYQSSIFSVNDFRQQDESKFNGWAANGIVYKNLILKIPSLSC